MQVTPHRPKPLRRIGLVIVVVAVLAVAVGWVVSRPSVSVASAVDGAVTIECTAATGVAAGACADWGDAILRDDPAPRTFERQDLRRVVIDRSLLGFGGECSVAFFISRYADRPAWSGEVDCP